MRRRHRVSGRARSKGRVGLTVFHATGACRSYEQIAKELKCGVGTAFRAAKTAA